MRRSASLAAGGYDEAMRVGLRRLGFLACGWRAPAIAACGWRSRLYVYHMAERRGAEPLRTKIDTKRLYGGLWRRVRERRAKSYSMAADDAAV